MFFLLHLEAILALCAFAAILLLILKATGQLKTSWAKLVISLLLLGGFAGIATWIAVEVARSV